VLRCPEELSRIRATPSAEAIPTTEDIVPRSIPITGGVIGLGTTLSLRREEDRASIRRRWTRE
jgi:hypothetical protein